MTITSPRGEERLPADLVYVMTGFAPNTDLLRDIGVPIDAQTGIPSHDPETLETTIPNLFIAGVVIAGFDANKVFIENGRYHGDKIVARLHGCSRAERAEVERRAGHVDSSRGAIRLV